MSLMDELVNESNGVVDEYKTCLNKLQKYRDELYRLYSENLPQLMQYPKKNKKASAVCSYFLKEGIFTVKTTGIVCLYSIGYPGIYTDGLKLYRSKGGNLSHPEPGDIIYTYKPGDRCILTQYENEKMINENMIHFSSTVYYDDYSDCSNSVSLDEMMEMLRRKISNPAEHIFYFEYAYSNINSFLALSPSDRVKLTLKDCISNIEKQKEIRIC